MTPLLDVFDFDPDSCSPFPQKYRSREEFVEDHIGYSQFKFDPSPHLNDNETDRASNTKEENTLNNDVLVDEIKCLAEQFNSANVGKYEDLEEACQNSVLNEKVKPIEKPNFDDKRVQHHTDKFNKNIEQNNKLLNQFIDICRCADGNELVDDTEFGLSIMDTLESGPASDKCKVK